MQTVEQFFKRHHVHKIRKTNKFKEEFSIWDWAAPMIQEPSVLQEYVQLLGLIGATIQGVYIARDMVRFLSQLPAWRLYPDSTEKFKEHWDFFKVLAKLERIYTVDVAFSDLADPIVLVTDRGAFEIAFREAGTVFLTKNQIPERFYRHDPLRQGSFDMTRLFHCLVGDQIARFHVTPAAYSDMEDQITGNYGIELEDDLPAYIYDFTISMKSGLHLRFSPYYNWGRLDLLDAKGAPVKILTSKLNKYLNYPIGYQEKGSSRSLRDDSSQSSPSFWNISVRGGSLFPMDSLSFRDIEKRFFLLRIEDEDTELMQVAQAFPHDPHEWDINTMLVYGYIDHDQGLLLEVLAMAACDIDGFILYHGDDTQSVKLVAYEYSYHDVMALPSCPVANAFLQKVTQVEEECAVADDVQRIRTLEWLDPYREEGVPDTVAVVFRRPDFPPERCCVRCEACQEDKISGTLLDEPKGNLGVHEGDVITFVREQGEDGRAIPTCFL